MGTTADGGGGGRFDESLELLIDQLKRVGELRDVDDPDEEAHAADDGGAQRQARPCGCSC